MIILSVSSKAEIKPIGELPGATLDVLKSKLMMDNPEYANRERRGFPTYGIPLTLRHYEIDEGAFGFPRGFTRRAASILQGAGIVFDVDDRTLALPSIDFRFLGTLRDDQQQAVDAVLKRRFGTLSAPTGSGKTVMALALVAMREQPTLIVVHTQELLEQWIERTGTFLGIPVDDVGVIGGGKMRIGEKITVALVQSLYKCAGEVAPHIGHLIVDECHRIPSRTFSEAVGAFDSKYMIGLSATPYRSDGLTSLIYLHLGDRVHEIDTASLIKKGSILRFEVIERETSFETSHNQTKEYSKLISELTQDESRNRQIVGDVKREAHDGDGVCLVLTDRKEHCKELARLLQEKGIEATILTGEVKKDKRRQIVEDINAGLVKVVVATGQLIGEGFDCKALSILFLASPVKSAGRLRQYIGRVLRPAPGKGVARVYDYVDKNVGVLTNAARKRQQVYYAQAA